MPFVCRPRISRWIAPVVLLIAAVLAIGAPATAQGADLRGGNTVTIAAGQQVNDDLYLTAGRAVLHGQANRDVIVAAGSFDFDGTIGGSLTVLAGNATLAGAVADSVRVAAGKVEISGPIGGDLVVAGGTVTVTSSGRIGGDLLLAGGDVDVRGTVAGKVEGQAVSFTAGGTFNRSVDVAAQSIDILPTAHITGNLNTTSPGKVSIPGTAQIGGQISHTEASPIRNDWRDPGAWTSHLVRLVWLLVVGAILIALFPRATRRTALSVRRVFPSLLMGVVMIWLLPLLGILFLVTVIGIPLALLIFAGYLAALYLSQVFVGMMIGRFILPRGWDDGSRGFNLLAMVIGVIVITAFKLVPVPFVPTAIAVIVTVLGLGGVVLAIVSRPRERYADEAFSLAPAAGWSA